MTDPWLPDERQKAIRWAKKILSYNPLFLDTETTGLGPTDEVVEVAVVDFDGTVLFQSLIKPSVPIPPGATAVHGITNEMVADAPALYKFQDQLDALLSRMRVVFYNKEFDMRLLDQSGFKFINSGNHDAMLAYASFIGDWDDYHQHFRWWKLTEAAKRCQVVVEGKHRAAADADTTRQIVLYMARQEGK